MKKSPNKLVVILEWGTLFSACGLIFTVLLQIITRRFFVFVAPPWTEEVSRFFFIYTISFGAGLAQRDNYFVSMDFFYRKFNTKTKWIIDLISTSISAVLFLVMSVYSIQFIVLGMAETSPSLGYPMSIAFASMLIMSGTVSFFLLKQLIHSIKSENK
jgi:TRAP-type C4-dicarboxylate transport system permease small subunit